MTKRFSTKNLKGVQGYLRFIKSKKRKPDRLKHAKELYSLVFVRVNELSQIEEALHEWAKRGAVDSKVRKRLEDLVLDIRDLIQDYLEIKKDLEKILEEERNVLAVYEQ